MVGRDSFKPNSSLDAVEGLETLTSSTINSPDLDGVAHSKIDSLVNGTRKIGRLALRGGSVALAIVEVSPINEAIRLSAFAAGEGLTQGHNLAIGALAYGASTLFVEGAGALAAAPLLSTDTSKRFTGFLNKKLSRFNGEDQIKLPKTVKLGAALVGGSVVAMSIEKLEDDSRSQESILKHGLWTSAWLASVCAVQGAAMAEGVNTRLDHPVPASIAVGGIISAAFLNRTFKQRKLKTTLRSYENDVSHYSMGPQLEGLPIRDFQRALRDKDSISIRGIKDRSMLFVPIGYSPWINEKFFAHCGYDVSRLLYCAQPQRKLENYQATDIEKSVKEAITKHRAEGIIFDYLEGESYFEDHKFGFKIDKLVTSDGSPAATFHYTTRGEALPNRPSFKPDPHIVSISESSGMKEHFDSIWKIYSERFQVLVDDHPIKGALGKQDLYDVLASEGSISYGYIDDTGVLRGFGYMVHDIALCPWLNKDNFIDPEGRPVRYFPGIASDKKNTSLVSGPLIKSFLNNYFSQNDSGVLAFECSNISSRYIPKLVKISLERAGIAHFSNLEEKRYFYNVLSLRGNV